MSGTVKSGLIFGLIGLIVVIAVSFVPVAGWLLCSPGTAAVFGALAGFFAVRWSTAEAGVGKGVLSGTIAGVGMLIGAIIFWIMYINLARSMPEFQQSLQDQLQQQPNAELTPEQLDSIVSLSGPIAGLCFGIINLLISLAGGAIGALIAGRNKTQPVPPINPPAAPGV